MKEHFCLNQIMEGDYECPICNPDTQGNQS